MRIKNFRHAGKNRCVRMVRQSRNVAMGCMLLVLAASCQKNGVSKADAAKTDAPKMEQMTKYLSVILGVSQDKISYDQTTDVFSITNTSVRLERTTVEAQYDGANEYKQNYENKN